MGGGQLDLRGDSVFLEAGVLRGETRIGFRKRIMTHVQQTHRRAGRQQLYMELRSTGVQKITWMPAKVRRRRTTRYERLREEGWHIWQRNPYFNTFGGREWEDRKRMDGELVTSKRWGFTFVKRPMGLHRRNDDEWNNRTQQQVREHEKKVEKDKMEALQNRSNILISVARIARRPMYKEKGFDNPKVVQEVMEMKQSKRSQLVRCAHAVLDRVSRSIFFANLMHMVGKAHNVTFTKLTLKDSIWGVLGGKKIGRRMVDDVCNAWRKSGMQVFVVSQTIPRAANSAITFLNDTNKWGRKKLKECVCPCDDPKFDRVPKMEGHVFQTISGWMKKSGQKWPEKWTAKARLQPDWRRQQGMAEESMLNLWENIILKQGKDERRNGQCVMMKKWLGQERVKARVPSKSMMQLDEAVGRWSQRLQEVPGEDEMMEMKKSVEELVKTPIDKFPEDGMLM